jgi:integrase
MLTVNPCSLLTSDDRPAQRERKQDHVWSEEEIEAVIAASERLALQERAQLDYSSIVRVAFACGLRLGELLGLHWLDIDLHVGELHVRRQWTTAGELAPPKTPASVRRIPLSEEMTRYLIALKLHSGFSRDDDPVFASRDGTHLAHRNVAQRGFMAAFKAAGIEGVTTHSTRHAFASRMIARGISSTVLARLMGHESSMITERRYIHLFDQQRTDDQVRAAMGYLAASSSSTT